MNHKDEVHLGGIAAAIVAAGAGAAACGIFYVLGTSKSLGAYFNLYRPSGALSGVSTAAILTWLVVWAVLARRWRHKSVNMKQISAIAFSLLLLGILLTFPPGARLMQ